MRTPPPLPTPALPQLSGHLEAAGAMRRRPPCSSPRTHTSAASAHAAGTRGAVEPARGNWGPSGSLPRSWGAAEGLPTKPGEAPASPQAWQRPGGLTFRSAGNSSFFTSPVAAAMLPAPENAASPSWDACSLAFSATARAGGGHQCPPPHAREGCPAVAPCPTPHGAVLVGGLWAGSGPPRLPARVLGRGGGRDAALQLGRECEQPPQILRCGALLYKRL